MLGREGVAADPPGPEAAALVEAGREAFTKALNVGAIAALGVLLVAFAITVIALRRVPPIDRE